MKKLYQGKHNATFLFEKDNKQFTLRKSINKIVDHENEIIFLKTRKETLEIDNNQYVKEYFPGTHLKKNNLSSLVKIKNELDDIWKTKISFPKTNTLFFNKKIEDEKYHFLVEKYLKKPNQDFVLCHGDLRKKNIIVLQNKSKIKLIDFEWVLINDKYFDLAHLNLYCSFSIKNIKKIYKINEEKLNDFIYIVRIFNKWFEQENYS